MYPVTPATAGLANAINNIGGQDNKKKPVLYRAGQAVGATGAAAHNVAAAGDRAADQAISAGVDATKLGVGNFVRGIQGKPALERLPTTPVQDTSSSSTPASAIAGPNVGGNVPAKKPVLFNPSLATMRDAGAIPATPRRGTETGVSLADGRKLQYGAMVNGVPTFSDGTAGVARTMSDAEIQGLGDRLNVVPATAFTRPVPAFNSDSTEANVTNILRSRQGGKFGITPEQSAAADLAAVTNQDARTTLGRAALNASRRANAASTTLQRKAALGDLAGLREGVIKNAALGIDNAAALERTNAANQATLQRQALANTGALDQQALQNEGALDRTDLAGQYGVESALAGAQARTGLTEKDVNAGAIKLLPQVLGLNAAGMIEDPNAQGGMRQPTEQEIAAAMQRAKAIIQGGTAPPAASTAKPTLEQFMSAARSRNPGVSDADLKAYYAKTYGG